MTLFALGFAKVQLHCSCNPSGDMGFEISLQCSWSSEFLVSKFVPANVARYHELSYIVRAENLRISASSSSHINIPR